MGLAAGKKTKTGYSTSASALEELAADHPIVELVLRWRELSKIKSTYADSLPKLINPATGRVHTSLNQAVTATGRLSSSDPNLQNIPIRTELGREIRKAFIAGQEPIALSSPELGSGRIEGHADLCSSPPTTLRSSFAYSRT